MSASALRDDAAGLPPVHEPERRNGRAKDLESTESVYKALYMVSNTLFGPISSADDAF